MPLLAATTFRVAGCCDWLRVKHPAWWSPRGWRVDHRWPKRSAVLKCPTTTAWIPLKTDVSAAKNHTSKNKITLCSSGLFRKQLQNIFTNFQSNSTFASSTSNLISFLAWSNGQTNEWWPFRASQCNIENATTQQSNPSLPDIAEISIQRSEQRLNKQWSDTKKTTSHLMVGQTKGKLSAHIEVILGETPNLTPQMSHKWMSEFTTTVSTQPWCLTVTWRDDWMLADCETGEQEKWLRCHECTEENKAGHTCVWPPHVLCIFSYNWGNINIIFHITEVAKVAK